MSDTITKQPDKKQDVTRGRIVLTGQTRFFLMLFVLLCLIFVALYMFAFSGPKKVQEEEAYKPGQGQAWVAPRLPPVVRPHLGGTSKPVPNNLPAVTSSPGHMVAPMGFGAVQDTAAMSGGGYRPPPAGGTSAGTGAGAATPKQDNPQETGTDEQLRAHVGKAVIGKPFNMHLLLRRNTIVHCVVEEEINTAVPGPISCELADDIMSADGTVVLVEKGATINGEVMDSPVDGEDRVLIGFDEVITQDGLPIYFNGSGGDELGASGVPGTVNEHTWRKLKATLLMAAIQIGGNVAQNVTQKSSTVNMNVGGNYGTSLAQTTLERDLNIRPSLYDPQAKTITITVRQDIPFDKVYRLRAKEM